MEGWSLGLAGVQLLPQSVVQLVELCQGLGHFSVALDLLLI